jgi:signal transduction histidine kinase
MTAITPNLFLLLCQCFLFSVDYARIKEAQKAAEDANNAKSRFLASMSHEIRTPMNAILGITQIQLQDEALPAEQQTAMEKIYSSGNNLLGIINDILDLSKIETGKMEINPQEYDIPSLINDTVQLNKMQIGSKPIEFILDIHENLPSKLIGDELRIKQVLNNLLSNAVKYTDTG